MAENVGRGIPMKDLRGYLTEEEVKKLIACATRIRDKLLLRLLWVTGARISEVVGDKSWYKTDKVQNRVFEGLRLKDILWSEHVVILDTLKRKAYPPPKRRVQVDLLTMKLLADFVLQQKLGETDKVFQITRERVFQIVRELGQHVGLEKVGDKNLHGHHLRHSHCVAYVRHNNTLEGLRKLQKQLGHADINTTAHYLQFAPVEQQEIEDVFGKW